MSPVPQATRFYDAIPTVAALAEPHAEWLRQKYAGAYMHNTIGTAAQLMLHTFSERTRNAQTMLVRGIF